MRREGIPEDVVWLLQRCDGYLDLRMPDRARRELLKVPEPYHDSTPYRHVRLRIAIEERDWALAAMLARTLQTREPQKPEYWIQLAQVIRQLMDIEYARSILHAAVVRFPDIPEISFNLACFECQGGNRKTAIRYLKRACSLNPELRSKARGTRDLEPIWEYC